MTVKMPRDGEMCNISSVALPYTEYKARQKLCNDSVLSPQGFKYSARDRNGSNGGYRDLALGRKQRVYYLSLYKFVLLIMLLLRTPCVLS